MILLKNERILAGSDGTSRDEFPKNLWQVLITVTALSPYTGISCLNVIMIQVPKVRSNLFTPMNSLLYSLARSMGDLFASCHTGNISISWPMNFGVTKRETPHGWLGGFCHVNTAGFSATYFNGFKCDDRWKLICPVRAWPMWSLLSVAMFNH